MEDQHLRVKKGHSASLEKGGLDKIDIAAWNHTQMVGGTICLLESLDPIEAAAVKMSTCFEGPFTLPDLAASSCSQWGGATHFDLLRLYRATQKLISLNMIETVEPPSANSPRGTESSNPGQERPFGATQYFQ